MAAFTARGRPTNSCTCLTDAATFSSCTIDGSPGSGRHDAECSGRVVEHDWEDGALLGEFVRDLLKYSTVDVRLGEFVGGDEARLMLRRQESKQLCFIQNGAVEQRFLEPLTQAVHAIQYAFRRCSGVPRIKR